MHVVISNRTDVHENLAAEEGLLDHGDTGNSFLLICRNDPCVVIGKNQNPWRECAVAHLPAMGIALARRITGGGTVYHDRGNLNVSLILPRDGYQREAVMRIWLRALSSCGVAAELVDEVSIAVQGRKVSGQAFCFRRDRVLHHGTLLWRADLARLRGALAPELPTMETRAVRSRPMPVMNLAEVISATDEEGIALLGRAMADAFGAPWLMAHASPVDPFALPGHEERVARLRSREWIYGLTPAFSCVINGTPRHVARGEAVELV